MLIFRLAALGFIAVSLAGKWGDLPHPDTELLQGSWEIISVQRSGSPDPTPVGLTIRFAGDEVHFEALEVPFTYAGLKIEPISAEKLQMAAFS